MALGFTEVFSVALKVPGVDLSKRVEKSSPFSGLSKRSQVFLNSSCQVFLDKKFQV